MQNKFSVKVGILSQGGGGVWPNPNFYKSLFLWHIWPFFAENFRQIHGKNPNVRGGGQGSSRLGQIPNFYRKFVLGASLRLIFQTHVMEWCFIIDIFFSSYSFRWKTPCSIQTTMSEYKKIQLTPQRDEASKRQSEIDYRPIYGTILSWYKWYIGEDSKATTNRRPGLLCDY